MTQPLFVDTAAWVAYFDRSDKEHAAFKDCLSRVVSGASWRLYTSDYIIDETATFLRYHTDHTTACTALDSLHELEVSGLLLCYSVDTVIRQRAEEIFRQYKDQKFSFTDCTSFALCQAQGIRHAATTDSDFRIVGVLLVPADVIP